MRYEGKEHQNYYPIKLLCKTMQVSRSAAYQQLELREPIAGKQQVEVQVVEVFKEHKRRYGLRRICSALKDRGVKAGRYKCRKVMQKHGLKAIQPRSFVPRTTDSRHPYPISPNLLLERKPPVKPNEVWVGDITYIPLSEGRWAYLSVWMDLYSRRIVGWQLDTHMREVLVVASLKKAFASTSIQPGLILHSDRGGQYGGGAFRKQLVKRKINQSVSRADNPYDNAFMESCFSRGAELLEDGIFEDLEDAHTGIFEYIEMYYNSKRKHSSLNYQSPMQYENQYFYSLNKQVNCP